MDYTAGQLAKLSGVTVRTLHRCEKLGPLPSEDDGEHRLCTPILKAYIDTALAAIGKTQV